MSLRPSSPRFKKATGKKYKLPRKFAQETTSGIPSFVAYYCRRAKAPICERFSGIVNPPDETGLSKHACRRARRARTRARRARTRARSVRDLSLLSEAQWVPFHRDAAWLLRRRLTPVTDAGALTASSPAQAPRREGHQRSVAAPNRHSVPCPIIGPSSRPSTASSPISDSSRNVRCAALVLVAHARARGRGPGSRARRATAAPAAPAGTPAATLPRPGRGLGARRALPRRAASRGRARLLGRGLAGALALRRDVAPWRPWLDERHDRQQPAPAVRRGAGARGAARELYLCGAWGWPADDNGLYAADPRYDPEQPAARAAAHPAGRTPRPR